MPPSVLATPIIPFLPHAARGPPNPPPSRDEEDKDAIRGPPPLRRATSSGPPMRGDDLRAFAKLNPVERDYVRNLKRKDRTGIVRVLTSHDAKRTREGAEAPLRIRVLRSDLDEATRLRIFEELQIGPCAKYIQWVRRAVQLPLKVLCPPVDPMHMPVGTAVGRARKTMDECITGHDAAKVEILKLVCQLQSGGTGVAAYSIGLEGPPGTGKTHLVRTALAKALGRPLVSIPLGGATDSSYLLGNLYTYEGSKEGRLAGGLIEASCCNPIVHFDEVDKISTTERGAEIASVLIHLIDPSANSSLRDRYFHGIDLDFSKCLFVFTYNDPAKVNPILLDRIKRVPISAPTDAERAAIVRDHILPRIQTRINSSLPLSGEATRDLLARASGGMRGVEKEVEHVLTSAQLCVACGCEDGSLAGLTTPCKAVLDAKNCVTSEFARHSLARLAATSSPGDVGPPPAGMYN